MPTNRLGSRRRQDAGAKWVRIVMAVLATVGLIDTGSITLNRWGVIGNLNCPIDAAGCDKVLSSPWGKVLEGIPLSLVGLLTYGAVLLMAILPLLPGIQDSKWDLSRRTWWGLFTTSLAMTVFSGVLLGLMVVKIQAFCFFCLLSAILSLILFLLTIFGGGWDELGVLLFRGILLTIAVLIGGLIWASVVDPDRSEVSFSELGVPKEVTSQSKSEAIALAEHLKSIGAVMYSAYWCPHCHDQKEMFGKEASTILQIVECAPDGRDSQMELCKSKELEGFPSWEINGSISSGVLNLADLVELSGYEGSKEF